MAESKIEWTDRSDWNPIRGCTRVSPGCGGPGPHGGCYAEKIAGRFSDPGQAFHGFATRAAGGRWTGKVEIVEDRLALPLRWKKPAKVFASSTSDVFHEGLSDFDVTRIIAVMVLTPHLTYQVLTKRSGRMREYLTGFEDRPELFGEALASVARLAGLSRQAGLDAIDDMVWPLPNVWFGVSVEDQPRADERREDLRATPAAVRFVSYEPALGPVDWAGWEFVDQIIGGGESGPRARPMHPDWQRATRDFCAAHGIAYFFKQWGEWEPAIDRERDDPDWRADYSNTYPDRGQTKWLNLAGGCGFHGERFHVMKRVGKKAAGRLLDGVQHDGVPA